LLEALAALGDWEAVRAFIPLARRTIPGNALLAPMSDRVEGMANLADGDAIASMRLLRRAAAGFARLKVPYEEARTLQAMAQASPASTGRASHASALAIYERLGVAPAAQVLATTSEPAKRVRLVR
jgi:hypothetical protein